MAGFWNLSQQQLYDQNGKPMVGAKAYFFLGGTTTPIETWAAYALGDINKNPNPVVADGYGRWPSVYMDEADAFYRVRVTTAGGVIVFDVDSIPIIGVQSGGGGGGNNPVNPNAVFSTGDIKSAYDTDFKDGWVRLNGRTIGSATSGASERANADTQALFEYLWNKNSSLVVVGGRGATANADWLANKQITVPDGRGTTLVGLDTMGNIAANKVAAATVLGWVGGKEKHTLSTNEIPSHTHPLTDPGHLDNPSPRVLPGGVAYVGSGGDPYFGGVVPPSTVYTGISIGAAGGGLAHNNVQPSMAITLYIKL